MGNCIRIHLSTGTAEQQPGQVWYGSLFVDTFAHLDVAHLSIFHQHHYLDHLSYTLSSFYRTIQCQSWESGVWSLVPSGYPSVGPALARLVGMVRLD